MKRYTLLVSLLCISYFSFAQNTVNKRDETRLAISRQVMDLLNSHKFTEAETYFGDKIKQALPADKLEQTWNQLTKQLGEFQGTGKQEMEEKSGTMVYHTKCNFKAMSLDLLTSFNAEDKMEGFRLVPYKELYTYHAPAYSDSNSFTEVKVSLKSGEFTLPGILSIPKGAGPFPAVILVHGSGPSDIDMSIGPNKAFKDLAWGLSSKGVAVLRYNKRTMEYPTPMKDSCMSLGEEVFEDVQTAINYLAGQKEAKISGIYVLGHSMGAGLAPHIMNTVKPEPAGIIMMAGPARSMEALVREQMTYISSLSKDTSGQGDLRLILSKLDNLKAVYNGKKMPASAMPFNICSAYYAELHKAEPLGELKKIKKPVLIMQGGRDYQVTTEDFNIFSKEYGKKKNFSMKLFPKLNHLFMTGEGKATPAEYNTEGHVDVEAVNAIVEWIKKLKVKN